MKYRSKIFVLSAISLAGIAASLVHAVVSPSRLHADDVCSYSVDQLKEFRDQLAAGFADDYRQMPSTLPATGNVKLFFTPSVAHCAEASKIWDCSFSNDASSDPERRGVIANLLNSSLHLCDIPSRQMGMYISDKQYLKDAQASFSGSMMVIPDDLKEAYLGGTEAAIRSVADSHQWKVLGYESRTVGNPPNHSHGRLLVYADQGDYAQWIQFTAPIGAAEHAIDMIAVQKKENGADLSQPKIFFTGFWKDGQNLVRKGPNGDANLSKCWGCHPNGLRQILHPRDNDSAQVLGDLRAIIASSPSMDFGPGYHTGENGPPLGQPTAHRDEVLAQCVGASQRAAIKSAMNCAGCHSQGSMRNPIDAGIVPYQLRHKILIEDMPPGHPMGDAADTLLDCLRQEYAFNFADWIKTPVSFGAAPGTSQGQ